MSLAQLVEEHRIVVCVGSGGVGKTTTSAALSVFAAMQGRRALSLTIDPARRLANSLGLEDLNLSEQVIAPALFREHGLSCPGSLAATMVDTKRVFDALVHKHADNQATRERILGNPLYRYVSGSLAGTQQYMAMEKLHEVRADPRYDLIVLDTPPTRNALDFLDAPGKLIEAIDSPVMRWFMEAFGERLPLMRRGAALVMRGLARFTGTAFLTQVAEFIGDINALFGGFRERAQRVSQTLRGSDVAFVVVTSPHAQNVGEAVFVGRQLRETGIACKGLVVNRVHRPVQVPLEEPSKLVPLLEQFGLSKSESARLLLQMQRACADEQALADADQLGMTRLRRHFAQDTRYVEVPALDQDVHDLPGLARIAAYLAGQAEPALATEGAPATEGADRVAQT